MIPHEEIRKNEDRSWTFKLLEAVLTSRQDDDLEEIADTLAALDDPRVVQPLLQVLEDFSQPDYLRASVSDVLGTICSECSEIDRRRWWHSSDRILRNHAIIEARSSEADILIPVASDPKHEFHLDAIHSLQFGFIEPEHQRLSIRALSHPNPGVRIGAANNLKWEEPYEAENALLNAISDPVAEVADEALTTISWFRSRNVLSGLAELKQCASPEFSREIEGVFECHREDFLNALELLGGESREFFLRWLRPIEKLLSIEYSRKAQVDDCPSLLDESPMVVPQSLSLGLAPLSALEVMRFFDDSDGLWIEKRPHRLSFNWEAVSSFDREKLARYFLCHTNHLVREIACTPLSLWNFGEELEFLLADKCGGVRKSAAFALRRVSPSRLIALSLWNLYKDVNSNGYCATETLESYVVHAPASGLEDTLWEIAKFERRQNRQDAAISQLNALYADSHLRDLLTLLGDVPLLTWDVHARLVDYCVNQRISTPYFADLCVVDDLNLQESLAKAVPYLKPVLLKGVSYAAKN